MRGWGRSVEWIITTWLRMAADKPVTANINMPILLATFVRSCSDPAILPPFALLGTSVQALSMKARCI